MSLERNCFFFASGIDSGLFFYEQLAPNIDFVLPKINLSLPTFNLLQDEKEVLLNS